MEWTADNQVREVRLSAGAEFVVAICGEIMTMPGLPKVPAVDSIDVGADGRITGLFCRSNLTSDRVQRPGRSFSRARFARASG